MPEFEEDPNAFKLKGFPVHEGTEDHDDAIEEYNSSLPFMDMVAQGMDMFKQGKEVAGQVQSFFNTDKKGGTPSPDETAQKPIGLDGV